MLLLVLHGCAQSIHDEVARGDTAAVKQSLDKSPNLIAAKNPLGKTPLHYAVSYKQSEIMNLLLAHGADLNAADNTGMTPLHVAAMLGRKAEAEWLLDHGAALEPKDSFGDTPMHTAAIWGAGQVIALLHDHNASLTARNNQQRTPLDLARQNRQDKAADYIEGLQ